MIPKLIHVSWPHQHVLDDPNPMIQHGLRKLVDLNPHWQLQIYDDDRIKEELAAYFTSDQRSLVESIKPFVAQVDIWRLTKIHSHGGLYLDIDRLCDQSLDHIATSGVKCVLPTNQDWDFSQDFLMSEPGNPIYQRAVDLNLQRRLQGITDVYLLGPQTYMHAVSLLLFGQSLQTNPGPMIMQQVRDLLATIPWIATYNESPPWNTVLYRGGVLDWDFLQAKRDFYHSQGVCHWEDYTVS